MKNSHNPKAKLTLDKLRITKLENPDTIKGGALGIQNGTNAHCYASDTFPGGPCTEGDLDLM